MILLVAPCKRIRNPESSQFLLLESGIQRLKSGIHNGLESRIHRFGLESGIQKVGIRNPKGWNPESRCWDPESRGWDPESRTFVDSLTWSDTWHKHSVGHHIHEIIFIIFVCDWPIRSVKLVRYSCLLTHVSEFGGKAVFLLFHVSWEDFIPLLRAS